MSEAEGDAKHHAAPVISTGAMRSIAQRRNLFKHDSILLISCRPQSDRENARAARRRRSNRPLDCARGDEMSFRAQRSGVEKSVLLGYRLLRIVGLFVKCGHLARNTGNQAIFACILGGVMV